MCEARNPFEQFAAFALFRIGDGSFASLDLVCGLWLIPAAIVVMQQARPDRPLLVRYGDTVRRQLVIWPKQMPSLLHAGVLRADM